MDDIESKLTKTLFDSLEQSKVPNDVITIKPCGPDVVSTNDSELSVIFPKQSGASIIPAMGGSIIKISFGDKDIDSSDDKYRAYVSSISAKAVSIFNTEDVIKLSSKNTSALRVTISRVLNNTVPSDLSLDIIPNLYLSSTIEDLATLDNRTDYFGIIRKNAKFGFVPIESIREIFKYISSQLVNGVEELGPIGHWTGLSGETLFQLYTLSKQTSPTDSDISKFILDIFPFFNLSEFEMLQDPTTPVLCGYFTIINKNIYFKMPDFSGFDSAGYGSNYLESSKLNLLFQLIIDGKQKNSFAVKNIEINKADPIFADVITYPESFDIKNTGEFSVTFSANKKPSIVYLSPAINKVVSLKNDILKGVLISQSGSFIEYNTYPNPFVSIFDNKINVFGNNVSNVDYPFLNIEYSDFNKIKSSIDLKYNNGLGSYGDIGSYVDKILGTTPASSFDVGFPIDEDLFRISKGVIGQNLTIYEFVGELSRQNTILHNGIVADSVDEISSGKYDNNLKYFKKEFVANKSGLCENYRPRVFEEPKKFVPSTWISGTPTEVSDGVYSVTFQTNDLKKFYSQDTSEMKFVVYAYDGQFQISKFSNGYLDVAREVPDITAITPNGTITDGVIISCGDILTGTKIRIDTTSAESVDAIFVGDKRLDKTSVGWISTSDSITLTMPCEVGINGGFTEIKVAIGDIVSSPFNIFIANGALTLTETLLVSELPSNTENEDLLHTSDVDSSNLSINPQYEIPLSYSNPRSRIKIKSTKKIFKKGRKIYLYVGFSTKELADKFSQSVVKLSSDIWVAKDFSYTISESKSNDFYRKSSGVANLFFPGDSNLSKPIGLLTSSNAYFVISTKNSSNFEPTDVLGILEVGDNTVGKEKDAFVTQPLVIGLAAKYINNSYSNHLNNFEQGSIYKTIAEKILDVEISSSAKSLNVFSSISTFDKFRKLIIFFKYRDVKKFKKSNFKLYIKDSEVTSIFSLDGVKKASDLAGLNDAQRISSSGLYYFVAKDLLVSTQDDAQIRIDIYDPDFDINISSKDKTIDMSYRTLDTTYVSSGVGTDSSFTNKEITLKGGYADVNSGDIFGKYGSELALTGIFANDYSDDVFDLTSYPQVSIVSNISSTISGIESPTESDLTISLLKNVSSGLISKFPNAFLKIPKGSEISSDQLITSEKDALLFVRLKIEDVCKLSAPKALIVKVPGNTTIVPGDSIVITVANMMPTAVIEISGNVAKIMSVRKTDTEISYVTVLVPEGTSSVIEAQDCGIKLYNGNQVLNKGLLDLGKTLSGTLEKAASGVLDDVINQFDQWKTTLLDHPLRFISLKTDKANLPKELMTSFCNFSFKITSDLSINLQGFTQLLVPVKVILCIIDVICNLFNPFQLPLAIIRLFECLYDLILLLPQISIPVMFLSLLIHILDLLECLVVKISALVTVIALVIDAIISITDAAANGAQVNFNDLLALEQLLMKYVVSLEADLEFMAPITQVLGIFLQLLSLSFRFPCSVSPGSLTAPCGIDGFELGSMISGLIAEQTGTAPHIKYKFKKEYLIPVSQPFTKQSADTITAPPSYDFATEPERDALIFDGSTAIDGNIYDISFFNPNTFRKKISTFSSDTDDITNISTDTYSSLSASYTRRRKTFESAQSIIFDFTQSTWKTVFDILDTQVIDENKAFDTPITLFSKDGENINIAGANTYGNLYSLIDGISFITDVSSDGIASVKPLVIDIIQNGITTERAFDTIPAMFLLDEEFNVYSVDEDGITFGEYDQIDGTTVIGISQIRATIMNSKSSTVDAFDIETVAMTSDPTYKQVFSLPQLYFVDTRVAAEAIQSKCQTSSVNQLPLDISGDGGAAEIQKMTTCLDEFLASILGQTNGIKESLALGKVPSRISQDIISAGYTTLVNCTKERIENICSIVINPLNTSFMLTDDEDTTAILPDTGLSDEILSGFEAAGPAFTGAREYAGGIGDAATVTVGDSANILIIPRDSYDNIINYDISSSILIQIISDSTGNAVLTIVPSETDNQNYIAYNKSENSYSATITAQSAGEVKIKALICNSPIQALTYSDLLSQSTVAEDQTDCVPSAITSQSSDTIPLGALSRISRILTITFVDKESVTRSGTSENGSIITDPQLFGTNLEN